MTFDEFLVGFNLLFQIALNTLSLKVNEDRINLLQERIKKLDNFGKAPIKSKNDYLRKPRQYERLGQKSLIELY